MTDQSNEGPGEKRKKATIFIISDKFEDLFAAYSVAISAASSNMDVSMLFAFWGLRALKKNVRTGDSMFASMLGFLEGGDINKASPGKHKFLGMGRWMLKKMMKSKNVCDLAELRKTAIELGVKMYSCETSMAVMEIPREKLIDEVAGVVGAGWLVEQSSQSDFTYSF